ncbi:MAG: purine permease [Firmicutes bacterium]|nr:purine permease [Bacillota bacterium]
MTNKSTEIDIIYGIDDKPKLSNGVPLAFQHILAMFSGNITVPLLVTGLLDLSSKESTFLIQCALFMAGVATLIQVLKFKNIGSGLPIVMGTSNAFLPVALAISGEFGIGAVLGAGFIGGLFEILIGKNLKLLKKIFTPLVSGIVILTIGITLIPVGIRHAAGGNGDIGSPQNLLIALIVLTTIIIFNQFGNRFLRTSSILMGLIIGYIISIILGIIDLSPLMEAGWLSFPIPFQYKWSFEPSAIIAMLFMFIATSIETIGDISAITSSAENRTPTHEELSGGVIADGLASCISAFFNAFPNTSYTQNIGVVNLTGVFSKYVVRIGAIILIILSLLPKFAAIIAIMPEPVLGGAAIAMFTMVGVSGISLLRKVKFNNRNMLIMAISLGIGVGLNLVPEATQYLSENIQLFLRSGVVPAAIVAIILNIVLPEKNINE